MLNNQVVKAEKYIVKNISNFLTSYYTILRMLPAYCCCKVTSAPLLLNGGTNTVVKVEDLFNKDSRREQSICSVGGFSKSENIAMIGLLMNFHTESATVILQWKMLLKHLSIIFFVTKVYQIIY